VFVTILFVTVHFAVSHRDSENALQGGSYLTSVRIADQVDMTGPEHCPARRGSTPNPLDVSVACADRGDSDTRFERSRVADNLRQRPRHRTAAAGILLVFVRASKRLRTNPSIANGPRISRSTGRRSAELLRDAVKRLK
jgi:hypothetical protein